MEQESLLVRFFTVYIIRGKVKVFRWLVICLVLGDDDDDDEGRVTTHEAIRQQVVSLFSFFFMNFNFVFTGFY